MNDKEKVMASETTIRDRSAVDWALLVARTVVGVIFMAHGAQKLFGAFGGPGLSAIVQMMGPLGVGARDHPIKCLRSARIFTIFKCPYRGDSAGDHPSFAIAFCPYLLSGTKSGGRNR